MRRIGWAALAFVVLLAAAFLSMVRFDAAPRSAVRSPQSAGDGGAETVPALVGASRAGPDTTVALPAETVADARAVPRAALDAPAMLVPVRGIARAALHDSWGDPRGEGGGRAHTGLDIMAARGTPAIAAVGGTIEKLYFSEGGGGITLYLRSDDRRWMLYYAHLGGYAPGIAEGQRVAAGTVLGYVGDTGNAAAGNHHLHFGLSRMAPGERWHQGTPVNPYPLLARGQGGG